MLIKMGPYTNDNSQRDISIQIDKYDTWSLYTTLAGVIHPALIAYKENTRGSAFTDDCDVPKRLKSTSANPKGNEWELDSNFEARWNWVVNQMIFAFEHLSNDCEIFEEVSSAEQKKIDDKISNGLRLFGKYYRALWT